MIVSLIIASKYQEDIANNNMFFSKCSGIRNDDLCSMEIEYLELIEYSLFIYPKEFENLLLNLNALFQMKDD